MSDLNKSPRGMRATLSAVAALRRDLESLAKQPLPADEILHRAQITVARYEPILARTYRDGVLNAWIAAVNKTARAASVAAPPPQPFELEPALPPPFGPPLIGAGQFGGEPLIRFPALERSSASLFAARVLTRGDFVAIDQQAKQAAFTVARATSLATIEKVRDAIHADITEGGTLATFRQRLAGAIDGILSPSQQEAIYRTQTGQAAAAGMRAILRHPAVGDEFPYVLWTSTHDSRTRKDHLAMEHHGQNGTAVYRADDPMWATLWPPAGWNCILPGTKVEGVFEAAVRSFYKGEAVEIITKRGSKIRVTGNHPVLTEYGWVKAGSLKKGDQLFRHIGHREKAGVGFSSFHLGMGSTKKNHKPTEIEKVFGSFSAISSTKRYGAKPRDFHGDGEFIQGNIDVVWASRELPTNRKPRRFDHRSDLDFKTADSFSMRGRSLSLPLIGRHPAPFQQFSFGTVANIDSRLRDMSSYYTARDAKRFGDRIDRTPRTIKVANCGIVKSDFSCPGFHSEPSHPFADGFRFASEISGDLMNGEAALICRDEILTITKIEYAGHVFDLQSATGIILADSLMVSNCRCHAIPLSVEDAARHGSREAREWLRTGVAPASPIWAATPYPIQLSADWPGTGQIAAVI
jgi:hypothetical protein